MAYVYGHDENKYRSHDFKLVMMCIVHLLIVNTFVVFYMHHTHTYEFLLFYIYNQSLINSH